MFRSRSFSAMALREAAEHICELIWLVDGSDPEAESIARLLRRWGPVVDVAGMSPDEAARALAGHRPDGILALADNLLVSTAEIAERLGLSGMTPEVARRFTDKHLQRIALRDAGMPGPDFWAIPGDEDGEQWQRLADDALFPGVLKPRQGEASRLTTLVRSAGELRAALRAAGPDRPPMVLEEYIRDQPGGGGALLDAYVSVETVVAAGVVSHVAISGRPPIAEAFREGGAFIPSTLGEADAAAVLAVASAAASAIGVQCGCLHTEIKLTPSGPRVIEVNGRICGFPHVVRMATGIDMLATAMQIALGARVEYRQLPATTGVGFMLALYAPTTARRVVSIEGDGWLHDDPRITEVILNYRPGLQVDWREGSDSRVMTVSGLVADHDELQRLMDRVFGGVRVHTE